MQLGIVNQETWGFLDEVVQELMKFHQVNVFESREVSSPVFRDRINRIYYQRHLQHFLDSQDVVFFEWASELLAYASKLKKTSRVITRLHRYELYQWADRIDWNYVDRIIFVSQAKKNEFILRFPEQQKKGVVIPVGISLEKFQSTPRQFSGNIGIMCHLSPRKRVYELILAFAELVNTQPGFNLHIGGGVHQKFPDYAQALFRLVDKLGIQDKVTFYGAVKDTPSWYQNIDIFISNSYSEGLQVSPMEAIASGCFCLVHQWDGAEEFLPEKFLYFSDQSLIDKINKYVQSPENIRQSARSEQYAIIQDRFNSKRINQQIRQTVENLLA